MPMKPMVIGPAGVAKRFKPVDGKIVEPSAGERFDRARNTARVFGAAAGLHALQLVAATIEFVVPHGIEFETKQVHRGDGRLVEVVRRDQRRCADRVAG
jgi:hypothetical protein